MATTSRAIASSSSSHLSQSITANSIIGNNYSIGKILGEGSFGVVYEGTKLSNNQPVAIKFEPRRSDVPQLKDEFRSYRTLSGTLGIPQVHHFGQEGLHNILVIDLLGPNLEELFEKCGRKFTTKTVCMAAKQMITRVQSVHEKSLIYRDIKPDNFLIGVSGTKTANQVHLIDFGMAKYYCNPKTGAHIPYRDKKSLSGTARYMSINTHLGREQSRRDDLESLGHVFMYFLRGSLPWQGLQAASNKQKYEKIGEKKQTTPIPELCSGFPEEFAIYMSYVRKLGFEEAPDYGFLRDLFTKVMNTVGEKDDGIYDWMLLNNGKGWEAGAAQKASRGGRRSGLHPSTDALDVLIPPNLIIHSPVVKHPRRVRTSGQEPHGIINKIQSSESRRTSPAKDGVLSATAGAVGASLAVHSHPAAPTLSGGKRVGSARYPSNGGPNDVKGTGGYSPNTYRMTPGTVSGSGARVNVSASGLHHHPNRSESYTYQKSKDGTTTGVPGNGNAIKGEKTPIHIAPAVLVVADAAGVRSRGVGAASQPGHNGADDDEGHGKRKGFWASLCCRS